MKRIIPLILATLLVLTFAACTSSTGKLDSITKAGEIVVYTDPNFMPFEYMADGKPTGVDIMIAQAIADELGVAVQFKEADFDSILMAVKSGKGDMAISGFTITDERKESVDFSIPYINSVQYLIVTEDSDIKVMEDLAGKKVAVAIGYTGQFIMEDETSKNEEDGWQGVLYGTGTELRDCNSAMEAVQELLLGRVDAVVMDEYVAKSISAKNAGTITFALSYADGAIAEEEYGVAIAKGNEDLLEIINKVVTDLVSSGKIAEWVVEFSQ